MGPYRDQGKLGRELHRYEKKAHLGLVLCVVLLALGGGGAISMVVEMGVMGAALALFLAGPLLLLGAVVAFSTVRERRRVLVLYERGVVFHDGAREETMTWDEVTSIQRDATTNGPFFAERFVLRSDTGSIALGQVTGDVDGEILAAIEDRVTRRLFTESLAALKRGERVFFGPIVAFPEGVRRNGLLVRWSELRPRLTEGYLYIDGLDPARCGEVPNLEVLLMLADQLDGTVEHDVGAAAKRSKKTAKKRAAA